MELGGDLADTFERREQGIEPGRDVRFDGRQGDPNLERIDPSGRHAFAQELDDVLAGRKCLGRPGRKQLLRTQAGEQVRLGFGELFPLKQPGGLFPERVTGSTDGAQYERVAHGNDRMIRFAGQILKPASRSSRISMS